jgi:hypothetical protein
MVNALREAWRVLRPRGILIDVRPVAEPIVVEVVIDADAIWATEIHSGSVGDDEAAADAAVQHALSGEWFAFEKRHPFEIEIYCDTAAEMRLYAQQRKLREFEISCEDLEAQHRALGADGQTSRWRCRRAWMLSTYRRKNADPCAEVE